MVFEKSVNRVSLLHIELYNQSVRHLNTSDDNGAILTTEVDYFYVYITI